MLSENQILSKPFWLKMKYIPNQDFSKIKNALKKRGLVTVCEEARCPNLSECWNEEGTATFMILGDTCTRGCKFCSIKTAMKGNVIDKEEPIKLASAIAEMDLDYAVLTVVDRDDLADGGSNHIANCIREIKNSSKALVEILIGDFQGNKNQLQVVVDSKPDVIAHNIETVRFLQKKVRDPKANYEQSLQVLKDTKDKDNSIITKSSIMLGLGETEMEVFEAMLDLRKAGCDILTLGQYMKPKTSILEVKEYISPEQFEKYKIMGERLGFLFVASGPFVRSSYRAGEFFVKNIKSK